eukprot:m.31843 g.31843  ORF g.31843 m.31843 type:complete len:114 (+) comp16535_c0_seq1:160-501(+)
MADSDPNALRLKAAVHYTVGEILAHYGEVNKDSKPFSEPFVKVLAELVFKQFAIVGADLQAFARHGKRVTIGTDDVKLAARRSSSIHEHISEMAEQLALEQKESKKSKKAKLG